MNSDHVSFERLRAKLDWLEQDGLGLNYSDIGKWCVDSLRNVSEMQEKFTKALTSESTSQEKRLLKQINAALFHFEENILPSFVSEPIRYSYFLEEEEKKSDPS